MAVTWTKQAADRRERLFRVMSSENPTAATEQDTAIESLASSLDGIATYQKLPNGAHFVPVNGYPIVILYDRDPAGGDATVLDLAPSRTAWKD